LLALRLFIPYNVITFRAAVTDIVPVAVFGDYELGNVFLCGAAGKDYGL
jgi:hypothetical protein